MSSSIAIVCIQLLFDRNDLHRQITHNSFASSDVKGMSSAGNTAWIKQQSTCQEGFGQPCWGTPSEDSSISIWEKLIALNAGPLQGDSRAALMERLHNPTNLNLVSKQGGWMSQLENELIWNFGFRHFFCHIAAKSWLASYNWWRKREYPAKSTAFH